MTAELWSSVVPTGTLALTGSPALWLPTVGAATFLLLGAAVGLPMLLRNNARGRQILASWSDRYGFTLRRSGVRMLRRGPFLAKTSARQVVFRVHVEDTDGQRRLGYVRVGHRWIGTTIRQVSVKWDGVPGMVHEKV